MKLMPATLCLGPGRWLQLRPRRSQDVMRRPKSATVRTPAPVLVHCALAMPAPAAIWTAAATQATAMSSLMLKG